MGNEGADVEQRALAKQLAESMVDHSHMPLKLWAKKLSHRSGEFKSMVVSLVVDEIQNRVEG